MRIRSIKPEFWRSDDIVKLPRDVRLLFIGVWSYVDDNGVGIDDHRQIAADLFALEDDPVAARKFVRDGLARLSAAGLIARYQHDGKAYLFVTGWRHQRVDKPGKPRYPRPDECGAEPATSENAGSEPEFAESSRESRESLAPGTEEQGNRGTGEQGKTDSSSPSARASARDDGSDGSSGPEAETEAAPPARRSASTREQRGTRLPDGFEPDDELIQWARDNAPTCGRSDHEAFLDYWRSVPGAKGRKVDWRATWRNWMRREHERRPAGRTSSAKGQPQSTTERKVAAALEAGARVQALFDQQQHHQQRLEIAS